MMNEASNFSRKSPEEKRLLASFRRLSESDRKTLLDLAEFFAARNTPLPEQQPQRPVVAPRPEHESVVKAIRRLSQGYPMLDTQTLFHETSALMTQHVMHGRPAQEIIDELEKLFESRYQQLLSGAQ